MRAPQLIGDEEKEIGFVQFPETETSAFLAPVSQSTTPEAKKQAVDTAVAGYTPTYASKKELKAANTYLYDFATWLTANRTKFSLEEITAKVDEFYLPNSTIPNMVTIWDDLHFNILMTGDSYLRDLLLSYLVADFFLTNRANVEQTAKELQKVAQAKVIIDKSLFSYEVTAAEPRTPKVAEKHFKKEMNALMAKQNLAELETIAKEVSKAKSLYEAKNQKLKTENQKAYDQSVKTAYAAATIVERVVTDSDSGETSVVKEYTNLTIPDYSFTPADELDKLTLGNRLSPATLQYITDIEDQNDATTLQEIEDAITSEIQSNTTAIFENTNFELPQVVVPGGVPVPVSNTPNITPFSYSFCPRKKTGSSLYNVLLIINIPNTSYDVVSVTCDIGNDTFTDFEEFNSTSKISLALCRNGIDLSLPIDVDITVEFSNGEIYALEILQFELLDKRCRQGQMELVLNGTTPPEAPVVYGIQRLGIADYRKIEQEVCCYVPGEVSHIENIMAREYKSKETRRTRRQETTDTFSSESERENLTETTSTDRFEMNQEIASMTSQDQSVNASAGVRWGGENFGGQANASFANNTASEDSENQAISHAKELTERALDRVVQKVREERVTKVIEEYEENTSHGFDNRKGDKHISGVYRWVDKVYKNKILNYGKRLMYEFMIPEPASFHDLAIGINSSEEDKLIQPLDPRTIAGDFNMENHDAVNETTYTHWAAIYNAEVNPMPEKNVSVTKAYSENNMASNTGRWANEGHELVEIPENYHALSYKGYFTAEHGQFDKGPVYPRADVVIAGNSHLLTSHGVLSVAGNFESHKLINSLEFSVTSWDVGAYAFNLRVDCELNPEAEEAWQIETFNTIIEAYEERLAEYNEKYAVQEEKLKETININPGYFREIEKTVLRKNCITYLLGNENLGKNMINNRLLINEITAKYANVALDDYAAKVKFFEQAFEWDIMSYNFYPFYWASKEKWGELYQIQNNDPLFKAFLQSGMARVIITVRPGFEEMVNWYMATGQVWNGGQVPTPDDEEFVSIMEELRNPESEVEETWESRVPTSLTVIQAGAIGLNVDGLPCDTDCDDWLRFDSDGNPALDPDGNPISDNPIVTNPNLIGGNETDTSGGVGSDAVNPIIVQ
jgi:hypothetical protein